jgi:hypothetical protein
MFGMLERTIFIDIGVGALIVLIWYLWFSRLNRRKAIRVLGWMERAFEGNGQVAAMEWLSASSFQLRIRLWPNLFRHTSVRVQLHPRETAFGWLISRLRKRKETLTFEADLDFAPGFNLEVHNHRWCGRTRRRLPANCEEWTMERPGPFVITTRNEWQKEITTMMNALVASRDCDCLTVSFSRTSPHFSATVPLESISPEAQSETNIFNVMRELAAGASASRF